MMIKAAKATTLVADFSKLNRRSVSRIGPVEQIHRLITDIKAPVEFVKVVQARGIEVVQV
jgi:DeoR/GlpR family transcriptional regulator of sugar metabolism